MANKLSDIVNVNVDIASPAVDSASFDNLLIFGPPPALEPTDPLPVVGVYSDLSEVVEAGFVATGDDADPIGIAARVAFSQKLKPSKVYIAALRKANPSISDVEFKVITADNALTDGIPNGTLDPVPDDLPWLQLAYSRQALTSLQLSVEKDGVLVYGGTLETSFNVEAYEQVCFCEASNPNSPQMGIPNDELDGNYSITLTAVQGAKTTVVTRSLTINNGAVIYTALGGDTTVTPEMTTPVETLTEALGTTGWYVACAAGIPENQYEEIAEWTEAQTKMFSYTFMSQTDPVGGVYYRSFGVCGLIHDYDLPGGIPAVNTYVNVAMAAMCLAHPAGSETWVHKQLAAVYPSEFSSTLKKQLEDGHSNYVTQYAGKTITINGQVRTGEWIDVIRGRDWLINDMQLRIFNLLLKESKVPYTNSGIAKIQNEMIASLKAARDRGIVANDEYDADDELIPGFTTSVPNSMSLTATEKASRILKYCMFSARLAGAIHVVTINGKLGY